MCLQHLKVQFGLWKTLENRQEVSGFDSGTKLVATQRAFRMIT